MIHPVKQSNIYKNVVAVPDGEEITLVLNDYIPEEMLKDENFANLISEHKIEFSIAKEEALERLEYLTNSIEYMSTFVRESFASSVFLQTYDKARPPRPEEILDLTCFNILANDSSYQDIQNMDKRFEKEGLQEQDVAYQKIIQKTVELIQRAMIVSYKTGVEDEREGNADAELLKM